MRLNVPYGTCPLAILAELGEQTANSWIYFHSDVVKQLISDGATYGYANNEHTLLWEGTEDTPGTKVVLTPGPREWLICNKIEAIDIAFTIPSVEPPADTIYLKMVDMPED